MTDKPYDPTKNAYWFESLAWLIREAPGLLGETSNVGGFLSAIESGGPGATVASSEDHHEAILRRIGLWPDDDDPRPPKLNVVERHRELTRLFKCLSRGSQRVLTAYYEPRARWPEGMATHVGEALASVALAFTGDRPALLHACSGASLSGSREIITEAKNQAQELIREAHEEWIEVSALPRPTRAHKSHTDTFARELAQI